MNGKIRLGKYLGEMGACSRRETDWLIEAGKVAVDGVTTSMGMEMKLGQRVICEGKVVGQEPGNGGRKSTRQGQDSGDGRDGNRADSVKRFPKVKPVLLVVSKPRETVYTTPDKDRTTDIVEFLKYPARIYSVGRLDKDSEDLLLMTNQGDLVNKIMRAGSAHEKEHVVTVDEPATKEFLKTMGGGVAILDTVTRSRGTRAMGIREFTIILTQGPSRQIRRMCEIPGYQVRTLKQARVMNLRLGNLKAGGYRKMTPIEYQQLLELLEGSNNISMRMEEHDDVRILIGRERLNGGADSWNGRVDCHTIGGWEGILPGESGDYEQF